MVDFRGHVEPAGEKGGPGNVVRRGAGDYEVLGKAVGLEGGNSSDETIVRYGGFDGGFVVLCGFGERGGGSGSAEGSSERGGGGEGGGA